MSQKSNSQADRPIQIVDRRGADPHSRAKIKNFTIILDSVVAEYGYMTALVHGVVLRHCQMSRGVCDKSLGNLAKMLSMSKPTIIKHLEVLCQAGLIVDTTPDLTHAPHIYVMGKQVEWTISADLESDESNNSRSQGALPLGVKEIDSRSQGALPLGVKEIDSKKHHEETRNKHHHHEPEVEINQQPEDDDDDDDIFQQTYDVLDQIGLDRPGQQAIIKERRTDLPQLLQDARKWLTWKQTGGKKPPNYTRTSLEGYICLMLKSGQQPPERKNPLPEGQLAAYAERQAESQAIEQQNQAALSDAQQAAYLQRQAESQAIEQQNQATVASPIPIGDETRALIQAAKAGALPKRQRQIETSPAPPPTKAIEPSEVQALMLFIETCCTTGDGLYSDSNQFIIRYIDWCQDNDCSPLSGRRLVAAMQAEGFEYNQTDGKSGWLGLEISVVRFGQRQPIIGHASGRRAKG